ncbi:aminoglycoside adenylyltransferase domain-containing protein [Paenibacillus xanthanilyticus]|uniref:Aminoglycoside adenylyltransferase domain-containing protein n=1 Tax=Paenibacillus xanthanilyticus TaxID=1783531 RepID=A0ABV8JZK0_9BACL
MTLSHSTLLPDDDHAGEMLQLLLSGVQEVLGDNLVGVYLRGSLALGDFQPGSSDLDFLVATRSPVTAETIADLNGLHDRLARIPNPYAHELEGTYIDQAALRTFQEERQFPTLSRGETLRLAVHRSNWVLERWTVREHGITLLGPDPKTLIDPISKEHIRSAVSDRLRDWAAWCDQPDDPAWQRPLHHLAYVVETMCRALYTLDGGEMCSKPRAVEWALRTLPQPWHALVEQSRSWRADNVTTPDEASIAEVRRFIRWMNEGRFRFMPHGSNRNTARY